MGSCAAPSAKGDDKFITTDYLQQCPDIYAERNEYNIIFPYGWEKKQLTREMRRMFPRKTGRRVLIMLDELHHFSDLREKP
ncbi:hypothetical protein LN031_27450, partial [Klebsiella pneumoniae]|nr:hypothetical protein [Klebsiella pneumoniae]